MDTNTEKTDDAAKRCKEARGPQDNEATLRISAIVAEEITRFIVDSRLQDRNRLADLCCCLGRNLASALAVAIGGDAALIDECLTQTTTALRGQMTDSCEKTRIAIGLAVVINGIADRAEAEEAAKAAEQPAAPAAPVTEAAE